MRFQKLDQAAQAPRYATEGAACFDFFALDTAFIRPGESRTIRTGLAFEVPKGNVMHVYSRSGHGFTSGVRLSNCVGVIDSDYRGELMVSIRNDGVEPFQVFKGDRIAQGMLAKAPQIQFVESVDLTVTVRGAAGLGSTGA